ncbi:hypothetical protein HDU98_011310 [Podochytrium sp. JEL0797]|nr:hypothetical protein HDU98_011310 [Podochytrium sp. JEL0797]
MQSSIYELPSELIRELVRHLPISNELLNLALSSRYLFGAIILDDVEFAISHIKALLSKSKIDTLWEFLDVSNISYNFWKSLPFNYQCAIYSLILQEPTWRLNSKFGATSQNLMFHERWRLPNERALCLTKRISRSMDITSQKDRAFRVAAMLGYSEVIAFLLTIPAVNPSSDIDYALQISIEQPTRIDILKLLLADSRVDPSLPISATNSVNFFSTACERGNLEAVKLLLKHDKVNPRSGDNLAIRVAVQSGNTAVVELLLADGRCDPAVGEQWCIWIASMSDVAMVRLLLKDSRVDPAFHNNRAILSAVSRSQIATVKLLMDDARVDPSAQNNEGLMSAARGNLVDVAACLLKDRRVRTEEAIEGALLEAKANRSYKVVALLTPVIIREWQKPQDLAVSAIPPSLLVLGDDQIQVEIMAAGVNFADMLMVQGKYQTKPKRPFIPGVEFAGVVTKVGSNISGFKIGDRVFGSSGPSFTGAFATHVNVLPTPGGIFKIPPFLSFNEAAGIFITFPTSWLGIVEKAELKKGEVCLVHAAAGGVGSAAVQIAKHVGAIVIGTAGGPEKCRIVKERLGADFVVDYTREDWVKQVNAIVKSIPGRKKPGVDVIYDPVGYFNEDTKCIAWNGRILVVGFAGTGDKIESVPANRLLLKGASIIGVYWGGSTIAEPEVVGKTWNGIFDLFKTARMNGNPVRPLLFDAKSYKGLESISEAMVDLASRKTYGKVVVEIANNSPNL